MTQCSVLNREGTQCRNRARSEGTCFFHTVAREPTDRTCPSCRIRWQVKPKMEMLRPAWTLTTGQYRWLENAARTFTEEGEAHPDGAPYTVEEFVAWIGPEVTGRNQASPLHSQKANAGHGKPDPIPFFDRRTAA